MAIPFSLKDGLRNVHLILDSLNQDHEQSLLGLSKNAPTLHDLCPDAKCVPSEEKGLETAFVQEKRQLITLSLDRIHEGLEVTEESETYASRAAVERRHFEFLLEMRQFDDSVGNGPDLRGKDGDQNCPADTSLSKTPPHTNHHHPEPSLINLTTTSMFLESDLTSSPRPFDLRNPGRQVVPIEAVVPPSVSLLDSTTSSLSYLGTDSLEHLTEKVRGHISTANSTPTASTILEELPQGSAEMLDYYQLDHLSQANKGSGKAMTSPPRVRALHRIVLTYTNQGKHDVAASLCLRAIDQLKRNRAAVLNGRNREIELAVLLNMLALIYRWVVGFEP